MSKQSAPSSGLGLSTVLLVVFVVLRLTDNIDWPWLWVLSPFWIPLAVAVVFLGVAYPIASLLALRSARRKMRGAGIL